MIADLPRLPLFVRPAAERLRARVVLEVAHARALAAVDIESSAASAVEDALDALAEASANWEATKREADDAERVLASAGHAFEVAHERP